MLQIQCLHFRRDAEAKRVGGTSIDIEFRPIDAVKPHHGNHGSTTVAIPMIAWSIREFGFNPIMVDGESVVISGHLRLTAARSLGMAEVPVVVLDSLSPDQVHALRLADGQTPIRLPRSREHTIGGRYGQQPAEVQCVFANQSVLSVAT